MGLFNVKIYTIYKYISGAILIVDEFGILLKVVADTLGLTKAEKGLEGVEKQAKKTDSVMSKFSTTLSNGIKKFATFATIAFTAIKTTMMGAWAYLDSTINRVEELQNSQDASLKTTKEQVEMAKKYRENMDKMGKTIENVKTRIALAFLPAMYEMSKQYGKLLDDNKDLIENGIKKLLDIATKASQVLTNFFKFINLVITGTVGWKNALLILVGVLAWVKRAMVLAFITNPIFWVVAAIAGLLLLIDDFMTYLDGGESEFGEFWGECIKWVEKAKDIWSGFSDTAKSSIKAIGIGLLLLTPMVGGFTGMISLLGKAFLFLGKAMFLSPWGLIVGGIAAVIYVIVDLIKWLSTGESSFGKLWQTCANVFRLMVANIASAVASIKNLFGSMIDWIVQKLNMIPDLAKRAASSLTFGLSDKAASAVSNIRNRITNNTTSVNASINVNGTTSPQATAKAVGANLNSMTKSNVGGAAVA